MSLHLLFLSAPSRQDLLAGVRRLPLAALRDSELVTSPPQSHRLALRGDGPQALESARDLAVELLARMAPATPSGSRAGVAFYGALDGAGGGRTACLFPGFGIARTRLLTELAGEIPAVDDWLRATGGRQGLAASESGSAAHGDLWAVLMSSLAMWRLLRDLGLRCDALAGHSYGENTALGAARMVPDYASLVDTLREIQALADRSVAGADRRRPLAMLALSAASRDLLEPYLASQPPRLFVALDNCPQQVVVWGEAEDLKRLETDARARGEVVFQLPALDHPVHTPHFPVPFPTLRAAYERLELRPAARPTFSAASGEPFPADPASIRDLLAEQWHRPVRFRQLIERLYAEGVRTFVEVGPGDRLSGFVRDTLRGKPAVTIATNREGRSTLGQLEVALAQLFVRGQDLDLSRLETANSPVAVATNRPAAAAPQAASGHPTLGTSGPSLTALVAAEVAHQLGLANGDDLDEGLGFFDLGLSSLACLSLIERLGRTLGRHLPQTLAFDAPTIRALAASLDDRRPRADPLPPPAPTAEQRIAIVGIGCRLPGGADSPAAFWHLLTAGRDAVVSAPADRWPASQTTSGPAAAPAVGGFLGDVRGFDAAFFGISPLEAKTLDPQQRLLLEVTWETLEHAAIDPRTLAGGQVGIFVGISNSDYAVRLTPAARLKIGGHLASGNTPSTAAGRLAYFLGTNGPCLAVDTACSSSLAAVHLACQSLRFGESSLALAGGVNLLINPETTTFLGQARALSPSGRSRTFDASADGYVRAEGAGMVALERLDDARRAGREVLAVIRGSALNHDGRTSGLTVPSGRAQEAVIRRALAVAGCAPGEVSYVETHGTGTPLGDPIEVNALGRVFAVAPLAARPRLGAVKTNIGHLEAAAGVAGLIKVVLQLRHRQLVPTLHFANLNPAIAGPFVAADVVTETQPWVAASSEAPNAAASELVAGVSAFGISGTNVHVIVAEPPSLPPSPPIVVGGSHLLPLSAASDGALREVSSRLADHLLRHPDLDLAAISRTLTRGRAHHRVRRFVVACSLEEAASRLRAIAAGPAALLGSPMPIAFVFTGQGAQSPGMGRVLYAEEPAFRLALDRCDAILAPLLGGSLRDVMFGARGSLLAQAKWAQPAVFAFEHALAALWRHWGVVPSMVLGHSIGELVAAQEAGVFSLEDGLRLVAARGSLVQQLPADGAMLAVAADAATLGRLLPPTAVSVAAINAPDRVVLSGPAVEVRAVAERLAAHGIRSVPLAVSHAFHSSLMDPVLERFRAAAAEVAFHPPTLPIISNLTGRSADASIAAADYWVQHLRAPVEFAASIRTALAMGCGVGLEIGPQAILTQLAERIDGTASARWVASLESPASEHSSLLSALGRLYTSGATIDWAAFAAGRPGPAAVLPSYPFTREPYWLDAAEPSSVAPQQPGRSEHPLLGARRSQPEDGGRLRFETLISRSHPAVLEGTRLPGPRILPAAAYLAFAVALGRALGLERGLAVDGLRLLAPLPLGRLGRLAHTVSTPMGEGRAGGDLYSCDDAGDWVHHATWRLAAAPEPVAPAVVPADAEATIRFDGAAIYAQAEAAGFRFGEPLRRIRELSVWSGSAEAVLEPWPAGGSEVASLLPLFDGCLQALGFALAARGRPDTISITAVSRLRWQAPVPMLARVRLSWELDDGAGFTARMDLADAADGSRCAAFEATGVLVPALTTVPAPTAAASLAAMPAAERKESVRRFLAGAVGRIMHLPPGHEVDTTQPLNRLGFDSLMALQLAAGVQQELGVALTVARIVDDASLATLVDAVLAPAEGEVACGGPAVPSLAVLAAELVEGEL
jgi:acyl transferase domain-containing protein